MTTTTHANWAIVDWKNDATCAICIYTATPVLGWCTSWQTLPKDMFPNCTTTTTTRYCTFYIPLLLHFVHGLSAESDMHHTCHTHTHIYCMYALPYICTHTFDSLIVLPMFVSCTLWVFSWAIESFSPNYFVVGCGTTLTSLPCTVLHCAFSASQC